MHNHCIIYLPVAPRAGAWIETGACLYKSHLIILVAPRAGAWIETRIRLPPLYFDFVAPRAGAWIETVIRSSMIKLKSSSHPVRVRGLKLKWLRSAL